MATAVLLVGLLVFLAHLFAALFEKTRVPDVLPLVVLGVLIGPVLGFLSPAAFGKAGSVFTIIALGVILFESGLNLDFSLLAQALRQGLRLTVLNFVGTTVVVGLAMWASRQSSLLEGLMLGAILGGTSSAVVIPMIRVFPLRDETRTVLLLEASLSDVLCIVVALALIQAARYDELRPTLMVGQILASFTLATILGCLGGLFWAHMLERVRRLDHSIFTTPAFVCIIYGLAELLGYSGAIAALAFGVTLGNVGVLQNQIPALKSLAAFRPTRLSESDQVLFAEVVFLLKTFFFVYIGVSIQLNNWLLVLTGLGAALLIYALRVPVVRLSLDRAAPRFDAAIATAMAPKGLAAGVLASLPLQAGLPSGHFIQEVTYAVILFSIVATCALTFLIERRKLQPVFDRVFDSYADDGAEATLRLKTRSGRRASTVPG
ncbi:MAG: cation:proton antiporter [Elusimicrobia bacterium]|nr:cation:proton antiporter [Elusimicrobiota bacterium]